MVCTCIPIQQDALTHPSPIVLDDLHVVGGNSQTDIVLFAKSPRKHLAVLYDNRARGVLLHRPAALQLHHKIKTSGGSGDPSTV